MKETMSLLQLFALGGPFMWPLLVFSIVTLALIVERAIYLGMQNLQVRDIHQDLLTKIESESSSSALDYCRQMPEKRSARKTMIALLENAPLGEHRMEKAAEAEANETIRELENGFNFLTALAAIAPLCGFLGTVSGMIGAFRSIAEADQVNAQLVAHGIYEALITTVYGLIIAIIAMTAVNILSHIVDRFAAHLEKAICDAVNAASQKTTASK
ncbi:MAG: MotA/TolQ/ExbB proton channel family protein [Spirochaetaceae bacterium]|nr:MAG: MotA/TolQ/ExbB proton channel family protein [Spirochaetaceae bacterium]